MRLFLTTIQILFLIIYIFILAGFIDRTYADTILVDFSKPIVEKRLYVLRNNVIVYQTYVAHGINSGLLYATKFSNRINSKESSLGHFLIIGKYYGSHGWSFKLKGLDKGINDNAEQRMIVIHAAMYIGVEEHGRSWGCFAVPPEAMRYFLEHIKIGDELISYK